MKLENFSQILFIAGLIAAGVLGFAVAMMLFRFDAKLGDWLSFVGAVLGAAATVLASLAVTYIQLKKQQQLTKELHQRELSGLKAILARDLNELLTVMEKHGRIVYALRTNGHRDKAEVEQFDIQILTRLQKLISLLGPEESRFVVQLLREIQIYEARLRSDIDDAMGISLAPRRYSNAFEGVLHSAMSICIRAHRLFDWTRAPQERNLFGTIEVEEVRSAERALYLHKAFGDELFDRVSNRFAHATLK